MLAKHRLNSITSGGTDSITKTGEYGTQGSVSRFIKEELENYEIEESLQWQSKRRESTSS